MFKEHLTDVFDVKLSNKRLEGAVHIRTDMEIHRILALSL
jgi:hypothetical protein